MKIILIGFMGSGKSTVGRQLARMLGLTFIDSDELVLSRSGRSSIDEIFTQDGEAHFREMEIAVAKEMRNSVNAVIATGGGAVMNQIIFAYLKSQPDTAVIYLTAKFDTVRQRLEDDKTRPLRNDIGVLYELREPLYRYYADMAVNNDDRTLESTAEEIIEKFKHGFYPPGG
mgnify:CR=1 FL=1